MDPWQASVEKRLDSLDGRAQRLEADVSEVKVNLGILTERVAHLPTKEELALSLQKYLGIAVATLTVISILTALLPKALHHFGL